MVKLIKRSDFALTVALLRRTTLHPLPPPPCIKKVSGENTEMATAIFKSSMKTRAEKYTDIREHVNLKLFVSYIVE